MRLFCPLCKEIVYCAKQQAEGLSRQLRGTWSLCKVGDNVFLSKFKFKSIIYYSPSPKKPLHPPPFEPPLSLYLPLLWAQGLSPDPFLSLQTTVFSQSVSESHIQAPFHQFSVPAQAKRLTLNNTGVTWEANRNMGTEYREGKIQMLVN